MPSNGPYWHGSLGSIQYQVTFPKPYDRLIELITVISIALFLISPPLENKSYEYWQKKKKKKTSWLEITMCMCAS